MKRIMVCSAICLACAAYAAPVRAQGLYEPFPEPASKDVARQYLNRVSAPGARLGDNVTNRELEVGSFLGRSGAGALKLTESSNGPSARADAQGGLGPSGVAVAVLAALVLVGASATVLTLRRA